MDDTISLIVRDTKPTAISGVILSNLSYDSSGNYYNFSINPAAISQQSGDIETSDSDIFGHLNFGVAGPQGNAGLKGNPGDEGRPAGFKFTKTGSAPSTAGRLRTRPGTTPSKIEVNVASSDSENIEDYINDISTDRKDRVYVITTDGSQSFTGRAIGLTSTGSGSSKYYTIDLEDTTGANITNNQLVYFFHNQSGQTGDIGNTGATSSIGQFFVKGQDGTVVAAPTTPTIENLQLEIDPASTTGLDISLTNNNAGEAVYSFLYTGGGSDGTDDGSGGGGGLVGAFHISSLDPNETIYGDSDDSQPGPTIPTAADGLNDQWVTDNQSDSRAVPFKQEESNAQQWESYLPSGSPFTSTSISTSSGTDTSGFPRPIDSSQIDGSSDEVSGNVLLLAEGHMYKFTYELTFQGTTAGNSNATVNVSAVEGTDFAATGIFAQNNLGAAITFGNHFLYGGNDGSYFPYARRQLVDPGEGNQGALAATRQNAELVRDFIQCNNNGIISRTYSGLIDLREAVYNKGITLSLCGRNMFPPKLLSARRYVEVIRSK